MRRSIPAPFAACIGAALAAAPPSLAQEVPPTPEVVEGAPLCQARADARDPFLLEVARARGLDDPAAAGAALDALEPRARQMAAASPNDPAAQFRLAAVMGARLEDEHGQEKMDGAAELRDQAQRVLDLEPTHPGASYMLGRIHASVLRLSGFKRFMAKQIYGGDVLRGASWEEAQALLETAVRGDPCMPEYHFELGRLYSARGDAAGAAREFASVKELTEGRPGRDATRLRERAEEMSRKL